MTDAVWDYDYIKYQIAAVCEKRSIRVVHNKSGKEYEFKTRTDFYGNWRKKDGGWLGEQNKSLESPMAAEDFTITDVQVPEPVSHALSTVKNHISNMCEKIGVKSYYGYIGKGDSWRVNHSSILKYKGQRSDLLKPLLLEDIEDYLIKHHAAEEIIELEADDQCVIDCTKNPQLTLIGLDKDYNGCAVKLFNPDKMETPFKIRGLGELSVDAKGYVRGFGRKFFYFQVLSSDDSDNYAANSATTKKWGPKSAYNLLEGCIDDKSCWEAIVKGYQNLYPEPFEFSGWRGDMLQLDWKKVLQENVDMAHMLRFVGDRVIVDNVLDKLGVSYQ